MCLRLTVLAMPPVIPMLHGEFHLSETEVGWLASLPPLMFAVAAVPGALLIARFGLVPALLIGLLLNAIGSAGRGAFPHAAFLYAGTAVMAAGVSIMQPALPPLVRAWFPKRMGFATAIYTNGLLIGEIVVVALTIPVILPLVGDSWRLDFVVWTLPVVATMALLALYGSKAGGSVVDEIPAASRVRWWPDWRDPLIWRLGLILGCVNATYFVSNAFMPDYVIAQGRADLVSAVLTAINLGQLPGSLLMLVFADRLVRRPWAYLMTASLCLICLAGMLLSTGAWIVLWSGVIGFAFGIALNLALALPSLLSTPDNVHRTSAGMFTISYSFAMLVSVLGGWLWDLTGMPIAGFAPVVLINLAVIMVAPTLRLVASQRAASP